MRTLFSRASLLCASVLIVSSASAADRDIQFRTVDFDSGVLELFNFSATSESLDGFRFCTHDDDEAFRYTSSGGLNGVSIAAGESFFIHFNNDATGANAMNASAMGGSVAGPFDRGPYGLSLFNGGIFGDGANMLDHLQWSIDGLDNTSADERSDEAESGGLWTDQSLWVATTALTSRLELNDLSGAELHSPASYTAVTIPEPAAAALLLPLLAALGRRRRTAV